MICSDLFFPEKKQSIHESCCSLCFFFFYLLSSYLYSHFISFRVLKLIYKLEILKQIISGVYLKLRKKSFIFIFYVQNGPFNEKQCPNLLFFFLFYYCVYVCILNIVFPSLFFHLFLLVYYSTSNRKSAVLICHLIRRSLLNFPNIHLPGVL